MPEFDPKEDVSNDLSKSETEGVSLVSDASQSNGMEADSQSATDKTDKIDHPTIPLSPPPLASTQPLRPIQKRRWYHVLLFWRKADSQPQKKPVTPRFSNGSNGLHTPLDESVESVGEPVEIESTGLPTELEKKDSSFPEFNREPETQTETTTTTPSENSISNEQTCDSTPCVESSFESNPSAQPISTDSEVSLDTPPQAEPITELVNTESTQITQAETNSETQTPTQEIVSEPVLSEIQPPIENSEAGSFIQDSSNQPNALTEPASETQSTPQSAAAKRPWYSFLLFGRGKKRSHPENESSATLSSGSTSDESNAPSEPAKPASFEEVALETLEEESPAVAQQIETVDQALHTIDSNPEHSIDTPATFSEEKVKDESSFSASTENTPQTAEEVQAEEELPKASLSTESTEISVSEPTSTPTASSLSETDKATQSDKSNKQGESKEPSETNQPKRRWYHAFLFRRKKASSNAASTPLPPPASADSATEEKPNKAEISTADTAAKTTTEISSISREVTSSEENQASVSIQEPSSSSIECISSESIPMTTPQEIVSTPTNAVEDASSASIETPLVYTQDTQIIESEGEAIPEVELPPIDESLIPSAATSDSESVESISTSDEAAFLAAASTASAKTAATSNADSAPRSIKLQAGQPRLRRTRQPFQPVIPEENKSDNLQTQARKAGKEPKKSKALLYTILSLVLILLIGSAAGAYWMLRETRLKLTIHAAGLDVQPEAVLVLDYSQRFAMIRSEYLKQRNSAQDVLDKVTADLNTAQAELLGKLKSRSLLQSKIDEDNKQVEAILDENQKKVSALLDARYGELDKQYDTEKAAFNAKLVTRAKELGLNFQPNSEMDDPEVSVNGFRLALYAAPKSVNVTQERLWAEDLLNGWHQLEETWESERASVRDQAISLRQPIGPQIDEIRARVGSIEKEIEAMDANIAPLREEVRMLEGRKVDAQSIRENAYKPFYEDALRLPADFTKQRFKLDDEKKLDLRKLDQNKELQPGNYRLLVRAIQNNYEHWALVDFEIREYRTTKLEIKASDFKSVRDMLE